MKIDEREALKAGLDASRIDPFGEWQYLLIVLLSILIVLTLVLPKIYLRHTIYYKSRSLDRLTTQYATLKEEQALLKRPLEQLKAKNQVLDTLF